MSTCSPCAIDTSLAALTLLHQGIASSDACIFIDLVELYQDRTVIVVFSLLILEISFVVLAEPYRHVFFISHVQINQHFLMTLAVNANRSVDVFGSIEANGCILEVREDIFFLDFDFSSALLLVVQEIERAIWTNDGVVVIFVDGLQVKHLSVLQII